MESVTIQVDSELCKKDGLCASVCPGRVFAWDKGQVAEVVRPELCCLCGQCMAVCPSGAITHSRLEADGFERLPAAKAPPEDKSARQERLARFVWSRRSVRAYRKKAVDRALLERVARSAGYAPTGAFGGEGWVRHVVVVSGQETMRQVAEMTVAYMRKLLEVLDGVMVKAVSRFSEEARAGRATLPDLKMRLERWDAGENVITYDAPAAIFVHADFGTTTPQEDASAALMTVLLTSHALGLGACWNGWLAHAATGAHVRGFGDLMSLLDLPDTHRVVQAATVGYPRIRLHSLPPRDTDLHWVE